MKRTLFGLLISWFSFSTSNAQVRPLSLTLDSLQKRPDIGYSLRKYPQWLFQPGHDARWASPTFDDRTWLPYFSEFNPPEAPPFSSFDHSEAPPGWNGVGWFRLHFRVDSSLVGPILAMRVRQRSASEIYLDGKKIGSYGKIGNTQATNTDPYWLS